MNFKRKLRASSPWRHPEEHSAWTPEASLSAVKKHSGTFWEKGFQASRLTMHWGTGKSPRNPESEDTCLSSPSVTHTWFNPLWWVLPGSGSPLWTTETGAVKSWNSTEGLSPSQGRTCGRQDSSDPHLQNLPLSRPLAPLPRFSSCPVLVCLLQPLPPHEPSPRWPSEKPYLSQLPSLIDHNVEPK